MAEAHDLRVLRVRDETPIDRTFTIEVPPSAAEAFRFLPGQFVTITDPEDDAVPPRKRAYSMSSSPTDGGVLEVTVRASGAFGERFHAFPPGKRLLVIPPRGRFTLDGGGADDLLLLAAGSGVAPFRSYVRWLDATGATRRTTLVYSGKVPEELVFDAEWRALAARQPWFRYVPTVTRLDEGSRWEGRRGRVDVDLVRALLRDPPTTYVHACGPLAFVDGVLALAREAGVTKERLKREVWG